MIHPLSTQIDIFSLAPNRIENDLVNRLTNLNQTLRLNHLKEEEKESILKICKEFNDIFHLHFIYDSPIHIKTYRYPQIHKIVSKQIDKMLRDVINHYFLN